jgi:IS30 family transposase
MARPRIQIDRGQFEKLCGLQCTLEEIAGFFNCSPDTVQRWVKREYGRARTFSDVWEEYSKAGKISIRRAQFKHMSKSPAMAIYLGKVYLHQREFQPEETDGDSGVYIVDDI